MSEDTKRRSHVFRVQHRELLDIVRDLGAQLEVERLAKDATQARTLLSMLAGKLSVHLAMEDKALYPRLLQHQNAETRELASKFMREMGGIHGVFKEYVARWPTALAIQTNGTAFVLETNQIFEALGSRIKREHAELFPMLDESP